MPQHQKTFRSHLTLSLLYSRNELGVTKNGLKGLELSALGVSPLTKGTANFYGLLVMPLFIQMETLL